MSRPSTCPACDALVDVDDLFVLDACPECATSLDDLFALAAGRRTGRRFA